VDPEQRFRAEERRADSVGGQRRGVSAGEIRLHALDDGQAALDAAPKLDVVLRLVLLPQLRRRAVAAGIIGEEVATDDRPGGHWCRRLRADGRYRTSDTTNGLGNG